MVGNAKHPRRGSTDSSMMPIPKRISWRVLMIAAAWIGSAGCAVSTQRQGADGAGAPVPAAPVAAVSPVQDAPLAVEDAPVVVVTPGVADGPVDSYVIGADDLLGISVYGESDLSNSQIVRPDGKIAFPLVGDVQASGLSPDELRERLTVQLARFVKNPRVTVIVEAYKSRRVSVVGEVQRPGVVPLAAQTSLLEAISRAGGVTDNADLEGAVLVRNGRIMPVNFEKLLRSGEVAQNNLLLQPADVVLIPNVAAKKVFVLGEVQRPLVAALKYHTNLVEAIAMAGGFTPNARKENVLVVRGGLGAPRILKIDVNAVTTGALEQNVALQPGDIVYAPRSVVGDVDRFFQHLTTWLQPIVLAETGIFLGPDVSSVLQNGRTLSGTNVSVAPQ